MKLPDPSSPADPSRDPVEEAMIECLGCAEEDQPAALEAACARHPELAPALLRRFAFLREVGLGVVTAEAHAEPVPERLGDFRILDRLGAGGMGVVYRAVQESLQREVALKLIRPERLYFPGSRALFKREVKAVAHMQHPGIVRIHLVGEEDGVPFYAMELVQGRTLASALAACRPVAGSASSGGELVRGSKLSWIDASCEVACRIALALAHAHGRGVVHRDVKPSNVMLADDGRVLLLDFGLASQQDGERLTRTGSQPGSLSWMSPEQVRGESLDPRTDVYSLGVTLYETLTLETAFTGTSEAMIRHRIERGEVVPLGATRRGIPWDVATVCATAMAPERERRYASAAEFAADLRAILDRKPITARRPGLAVRTRRFVQRRPTFSVALAFAGVLCLGVPVALLVQEQRARKAIEQEAQTARQVTDFLVELFGNADPHYALQEDVRVVTLVDEARERLRGDSISKPEIRAEMLETLGKVYSGLGRPRDAVELLTEARRIRAEALRQRGTELLEATELLGLLAATRGDLETAETELRAALALLERDPGHDPNRVATVRAALGETLMLSGRTQEAQALLFTALEDVRRDAPQESRALAAVLHRVGKFQLETEGPAAAEPNLAEAVAMYDRGLPGQRIEKVIPLSTLGYCLFQLGRRQDAEPVLQRALELALRFYGPDHLTTASIQEQRAGLFSTAGRLDEAQELLDRAVAIYRTRLTLPDRRLARSEAQAAILLGQRGRFAESAEAFERSLAQYRELGNSGLAGSFETAFTFGKLLVAAGRTKAAETMLHDAVATGHRLERPPVTMLAMARAVLGRCIAARGALGEGLAHVKAASTALRSAGCADTTEMAAVLRDEAQILLQAENALEARAVCEEMVAILERAGVRGERSIPDALSLRSAAHQLAGARELALADATSALERARGLFPAGATLLVGPLRQSARLATLAEDHPRALALFEEAVAIARRATGGQGETFASLLCARASALLSAGDPAGAQQDASTCLGILEASDIGPGPTTASLLELLAELALGMDVRARACKAAARWLPEEHPTRLRIERATSAPTSRPR